MEDETVVATENPIKKVVSMGDRRYDSQKTIEDEHLELEELIKEQKEEAEKDEIRAKVREAEEFEPSDAEEKTFKKRYGDLRRHSQKQQQANEEKITSLKSQLADATKKQIDLPKTEKELEAWTHEYPDVAAIIETIAIKKSQEQTQDFATQMADMKREKAEVELLSLHPDFAEIRTEDDFHTWAEEQPKWIQDALYENETDARSASRAIDLYKADKGIDSPRKKNTKRPPANKKAAKLVNPRSSKAPPEADQDTGKWKESVVDGMSPQEYEKNADSIMDAIRNGEFVYDVSGNAR